MDKLVYVGAKMIIRTSNNILVNIDNVESISILNCADERYKIKAITRSGKEIVIGSYDTKEKCAEKFDEICADLNAKNF